MAQLTVLKLTAKKVVRPNGSIAFDTSKGDTAKDITLGVADGYVIFSVPGANSTTDALIITATNWQVTCAQEYADVATALSASDQTNS